MSSESLVTISASYRAGGSRVGPLLAERLDAPFAERVMRRRVADRVAGPLTEAKRDQQPVGRSLGRILCQISGERSPDLRRPTAGGYSSRSKPARVGLARSGADGFAQWA